MHSSNGVKKVIIYNYTGSSIRLDVEYTNKNGSFTLYPQDKQDIEQKVEQSSTDDMESVINIIVIDLDNKNE
jgi:hypothetical protein